MLRQRVYPLITTLIVLSLSISACASKATPTATQIPTATEAAPTATLPAPTLAPTNTPAPTVTLAPTATMEPSATLVPSATPEPSATAILTGTTSALTFKDGLGRTVILSGYAQRVVSLAPSNTEILYWVGAGSQIIARDEFSDYPDTAKTLPSIGGSYGGYDMEKIVSLKPDLVLAAEINTADQVKALTDLGLTVYLLPNPVTLDQMYGNLETVAQMTGRQDQTSFFIDKLKARVQAVVDKVKTLADTDRPLVYYEFDASDPTAPFTAGAGTFVDTLISMAGGKNVGGSLTTPWAQISAEKVIELNPAIILLGDAAYGTTLESVATRAGWKAIDAVKNNAIYPIDDNLVSRPGPRLVDGLEALVKIIHPELYK